jgi:hypothetical protein
MWQKQAPGFTQPGAFFFVLFAMRLIDEQSTDWPIHLLKAAGAERKSTRDVS